MKSPRIEQTLQHREERSKELSRDLEQVEHSWEEAREQLADDQQQLESFQEELIELEPELAMLQDQEADSGDVLTRAEEAMQRWQQEWDHFNQRSHEPKRTAEVEQSRIHHAEQVMGRLQEREGRLKEESAALGGTEDQEEMTLLSEKLTELELTAETVELRIEECVDAVEQQRDQVQNLTAELESNRDELSMVRGRHASLEALYQASLHQDTGTIEWLEQHQLNNHTRLMDKLQVDAGWERSVETVLGASLQAVCLDSLDPVADALGALEQGSLVLLEAGAGQQSTPSLSELPLLEDKVISGQEALSLLAGIYAADSLETALSLRAKLQAGESIITPDGIWLSSGWLRVNRGVDNNAGVLERQKEMDALGDKLTTLEESSLLLKEQLEGARAKLEQHETQREQLQKQLSELNRNQGEVRADLGARKVRLEQFSERRRRLEQELQEVREQYGLEQEVIGESRMRLQEALDHMEEDIGRREAMQEQREKLQARLEEVRHQARFDQERAHQLALRQQSINTQIASLKAAIERLSQQSTKLRERREFLRESMSESNSPEGDLREQLEEMLARRLEQEETMQQARMALEEVEQRIRAGEKVRHSAEQQAQKIREQLEKLRMDWQGMQVRRTTLAEQLKEDQFDLATVLENLPDDASEQQWEQELERIAARIERLGAINLAAIEEYETQSERKQYLDAQNDDLESALNTLENAIRKIDKETRQRFKMTFDKVNAGLQELFPRVFGGGQAYLALTGEDLLDTGVAIMAQPPGKKNSTIHLLSGGEKALTAIALVFAIFQLNPSPFCMLDEVDAPLDDANVGRYAKMVSEMSDKVQFVYITHNKIAMQAASQLVGVTMHEPGVSRPVSVDIEQAAAMAEL
ncbi:chromosome segregation protein SMC [Endozoicomonas sp. GU-1]|uniref:chromosome segregation protein SMC n=1 Tax=Endozoicomonas sp. GU-1 TaxID=3009078 RepID=UPI002FC2C564